MTNKKMYKNTGTQEIHVKDVEGVTHVIMPGETSVPIDIPQDREDAIVKLYGVAKVIRVAQEDVSPAADAAVETVIAGVKGK